MGRFMIGTRPAPINWECKTQQERILQNAKNLLMTRMCEVPFDRLRGLNPGVYDKPIDYVRDHIPMEMRRLLAWEPNVELVGVEVTSGAEGTDFLVTIEVPDDLED